MIEELNHNTKLSDGTSSSFQTSKTKECGMYGTQITDYSFIRRSLSTRSKTRLIKNFLFLYLESDDIISILHWCQCLGRDCGPPRSSSRLTLIL